MSEFINTIDLLGDEIVLAKLIERSLTEINDDVLTLVGYTPFYYNKTITSVNLPNVTTLYAGFEQCKSLISVNLPNLTNIVSKCFYACQALTDVNIPKAKSILGNTFYYCKVLVLLDLPQVTSISSSAFDRCSELKTLILRSETLCTLSNTNAFSNTPIASGSGYIYVPRALIDTYKSATNWSTYAAQFRVLEDYTVDGTTTGEFDLYAKGTEGLVYQEYYDSNPLYAFSVCTGIGTATDTDIVVASKYGRCKVTTIGGDAFKTLTLNSLTIPDTVTSFGMYAIYDCKIGTITIGSKASSIGAHTLSKCTVGTLVMRATTPPTLGSNIKTNGTTIGKIIVPKGCAQAYKSATNWSAWTDIIEEEA